jgi:hypothetical protein
MAAGKYDKYFIFEGTSSALHPKTGFPWVPITRIDDRLMPGLFYFECVWQVGEIPESKAYKPHSHDCDELVGFFGTNLEDPTNLNAEIEFWFEDEKHVFTKNCVVYIPAGKWHSPILVKNLTRPVFCFSTAPTSKYTQKVNRDNPRWAHLPDPPEGKA